MDHFRDNLNQGSPAEGKQPTRLDENRAGSQKPRRVLEPIKTPYGGNTKDADNRMYRLLTVGEVAVVLNVPRKWVYRRVGLKPPQGIPYLKVGKYLRFRESDLREYVERLRRN
jgi:excisionase family DNA binding protein